MKFFAIIAAAQLASALPLAAKSCEGSDVACQGDNAANTIAGSLPLRSSKRTEEFEEYEEYDKYEGDNYEGEEVKEVETVKPEAEASGPLGILSSLGARTFDEEHEVEEPKEHEAYGAEEPKEHEEYETEEPKEHEDCETDKSEAVATEPEAAASGPLGILSSLGVRTLHEEHEVEEPKEHEYETEKPKEYGTEEPKEHEEYGTEEPKEYETEEPKEEETEVVEEESSGPLGILGGLGLRAVVTPHGDDVSSIPEAQKEIMNEINKRTFLSDLTGGLSPEEVPEVSSSAYDAKPTPNAYGAVPEPSHVYGASPTPSHVHGAYPTPSKAYGAVPTPSHVHGAYPTPSKAYGAVPTPSNAYGMHSEPSHVYESPSPVKDSYESSPTPVKDTYESAPIEDTYDSPPVESPAPVEESSEDASGLGGLLGMLGGKN